jgi:glutaconate CoA-transferase subunit A
MPQKKNSTIDEVVQTVKSGSTLAIGGMTIYRRPVALVKALIRRFLETGEPKELTLLAFTAGFESDLLVGAGMVRSIHTCYFGLEIFGLAPMFTYYANRGMIEIFEETEASLAFGLRAQIANVGFMPGRAWIGTDLPRLRPDVKKVIDPYSGEELMAFPAIRSDVAFIHALDVDKDGNAVIGDNKGVDEELVLTSDKVFVSTERIVPQLEKVDLVSPILDGIVVIPEGASPTSCHPFYPIDGLALLDYTEKVSNPENFQKYIEEWL